MLIISEYNQENIHKTDACDSVITRVVNSSLSANNQQNGTDVSIETNETNDNKSLLITADILSVNAGVLPAVRMHGHLCRLEAVELVFDGNLRGETQNHSSENKQ